MTEVQGNPNKKDVSPKLSQFTEELNNLLDKYQYTIKPSIRVTEAGIVPLMNIVDKIPPKTVEIEKPKKVKKKGKK